MSHQAAREYGKFYNHYKWEAKREVKAAYVPDVVHEADRTLTGILTSGLPGGVQGKFNPLDTTVQLTNRLRSTSPTKMYHVRYAGPNLGLENVHEKRKGQLFTELPGQTFNTKSWAAFSQQAAAAKALASPIRRRPPTAA